MPCAPQTDPAGRGLGDVRRPPGRCLPLLPLLACTHGVQPDSHPSPDTDPTDTDTQDTDTQDTDTEDTDTEDTDTQDTDTGDSNVDTDGLPDLIVDPVDLGTFLSVDTIDVAADSCQLLDGCVGAAGSRKVLRFLTTTANVGTADLVIGAPEDHPEDFQWSACDEEWKYTGFASYKLLDSSGAVAAVGGKSAFCIMDERNYAQDGSGPVYTCGTQGLSVGWADVYAAGLDCQWIDVTDVPAGDYTLEVSVAPDGMLPELSNDNNTSSVAVTLPG